MWLALCSDLYLDLRVVGQAAASDDRTAQIVVDAIDEFWIGDRFRSLRKTRFEKRAICGVTTSLAGRDSDLVITSIRAFKPGQVEIKVMARRPRDGD